MIVLLVSLLAPAFACGDKGCDSSSCPMAGAPAAAPATAAIPAGSTVTKLKVGGMHCGACAEKITAALKGVQGVTAANVSYETGVAEVGYDDKKTKVDALVAAVTAAGFTATKM